MKLFDIFKYKTSMNKVYHKVIRFFKKEWDNAILLVNLSFICSFDNRILYNELKC